MWRGAPVRVQPALLPPRHTPSHSVSGRAGQGAETHRGSARKQPGQRVEFHSGRPWAALPPIQRRKTPRPGIGIGRPSPSRFAPLPQSPSPAHAGDTARAARLGLPVAGCRTAGGGSGAWGAARSIGPWRASSPMRRAHTPSARTRKGAHTHARTHHVSSCAICNAGRHSGTRRGDVTDGGGDQPSPVAGPWSACIRVG